MDIVDDYIRECLAIEVDTSLSDCVLPRCGNGWLKCVARSISVDNGREFAGRALDAWAYQA
ncbi:hypothetical protein D3C85_1923600 [compost metagenome]